MTHLPVDETSAKLAKEQDIQSIWMVDSFSFTPWYTAALTQALARLKVDVSLTCGDLTREPGYFQSKGLPIRRSPVRLTRFIRWAPRGAQRLGRTVEIILGMYDLMHSIQSKTLTGLDILHLQQVPLVQHGIDLDFDLIQAAAKAGVPTVHTVHNLLPHDTGNRFKKRYLKFYRCVDHLICHSEGVAQELIHDFQLCRDRISVIPHGPLFAPAPSVSVPDMVQPRKYLNLPEDRVIVLWQGVLARYKGLDVLLDTWELCLDKWKNCRAKIPMLVIAGSGPDALRSAVRARAAKLGESVRVELRYIPSDEIGLFHAAADLLVYPHRAITTSGALLTGLSYNKPIVASKLPAFEEYLIHGKNALLPAAGSSSALAKALLSLLGGLGMEDPPLVGEGVTSRYSRLAEGARNNHLLCSGWPEIARLTIKTYDSVLRRYKIESQAGVRKELHTAV